MTICQKCGKEKCLRKDGPLDGCYATPSFSHNADLGKNGEFCHGCCRPSEEGESNDYIKGYTDGANYEHDRCQIEHGHATPQGEVGMGVSQWREHGIRFQYDKYFKIVWPD